MSRCGAANRDKALPPVHPCGNTRVDDAFGIESVMAVEVRNVAGLAEMFHTERMDAVSSDRSEPGEGRRMAIEDGDQHGVVDHPRGEPQDLFLQFLEDSQIPISG